MAATTISRSTWTDGVSGTVIANARLQGDVYDPIDNLIGNNITLGGTISAEGFGTHSFSAGGTGANIFRIRNTSAGTANYSELQIGNNSSASLLSLQSTSSTYTPDTANGLYASGVLMHASGAGGLNLRGSAGDIRFFSSSGLRGSVTTAGIIAENTFSVGVKNTAGTVIPALTVTSGNDMSIGSDSAASVGTLTISAGGAISFRMNSAERVVMTATGLLQVADGSAAAPSVSFVSNTDDGLYLVAGANNGPGISRNGVLHTVFKKTGATEPQLEVPFGSFGTGARLGCSIRIGRNDSGNGAAGYIAFDTKSGSIVNMWIDNVGTVRVGAPPTEDGSSSDTGGTVVGSQSSSRTVKQHIAAYTDTAGALQIVRDTPVFSFRYKPGHGIQGEDFIGIITEESPIFGMDRDAEHPAGRSLNTVNAIGLLIAANQELAKRIEALEA